MASSEAADVNVPAEVATMLLSSRVTPNVMKKDVGVVLIRTLFQMELKVELSLTAGIANAFCKWRMAASLLRERQAMQVAEKNDKPEKESSLWHMTAGTSPDGSQQEGDTKEMRVSETEEDANLVVEKGPGFETSILALDALYNQLTRETKSMQKKLEELREHEENGEGFEKAGNEGKLLLSVMYMRLSMKRQLRRAFDTWFFTHVRRSNSLMNVKKLGTSLTLESHKTATRQFNIASKLEQNETVGNAIECSHAFFRWKFAVVKVILQEERSNGEQDRKKLFKALRDLKALLHGKIRQNKSITDSSRTSGDKLARRINQLHSSLSQADALNGTLSGLVDREGAGEKVAINQSSSQFLLPQRR